MSLPLSLALFGGSKPWSAHDWTASDDRVRGGSSQSYLSVEPATHAARFHGNLDTQTLGGAGFASQRTTATDESWDLSQYEGLELLVRDADQKRYTFNVKDSLPGQRPDGRDESSISWEVDFTVGHHVAGVTAADISGSVARIRVPWSSFVPTYRGRKQDDAPPLKTESIRRFSIMCRSFFDQQMGPFSITLGEIRAYAGSAPASWSSDEKVAQDPSTRDGWLDSLKSCLGFRSRNIRL